MRKRQNTDIATKKEIMDVAYKLFMEHGYEGTSVRMILDASNSVSGSFYYYFSSKEALFEEVVMAFMQEYSQRINEIAFKDNEPFALRIIQIITELEKTVSKYFSNKIANINLHWTIQYAIHKKTVESMIPAVEHLVNEGLKAGKIKNKLGFSNHLLAVLVLQGVEGIIHEESFEKMSPKRMIEIKNNIKLYLSSFLQEDL